MSYTQEAFLGAGDLQIDTYDADGNKTGELDVGNAIQFTINAPSLEKKELIGMRRANYAQTIKSVITKTEQELKFTLTDINKKNLALAMFGADSAYTQTAGNSLTTDETAWEASTAYSLDDIVVPTTDNGHTYKCTTAGTSDASEPTWPTDGTTVSDGTVVWTDQGLAAEAITAHLDKWTKLTNRNLDPATPPVVKDETDTTTYVEDTDYEVDYLTGRIKALSTGSISDGDTLHVGSTWLAITDGYKVAANDVNKFECFIRLIGEDQANNRAVEVIVHKAQIEPSGDINWLTEDFAQLEFSGKILATSDGTWDFYYLKQVS